MTQRKKPQTGLLTELLRYDVTCQVILTLSMTFESGKRKIMTYSPFTARAAFERNKDNPVVQGLVRFLDQISCKVEDILSWEIEENRASEDYILRNALYGSSLRFNVTLTDGKSGVKGWLRKRVDQSWEVYEVQATFTNYINTDAD